MIQLTIAPKRVLVVARALNGITHLIAPLREAGCRVELARTPAEAIDLAGIMNPEVVVIEDRLDDVNSVELSVQIGRIVSSDPPPTFIMAVSHELSEEHSAADVEAYETKHASDAARASSATQSIRVADLATSAHDTDPKPQPVDRLVCRGLCLDRMRHRAWIGRRSMHLTPTEFNLLWELARRPGCVLTRADLSKVCKGASNAVQTRTIDAHVKSIRRKLKDQAGLIETVHGIGYRFLEPE